MGGRKGIRPIKNMGIKKPRFVFWTNSTIKDEKSAAKFHYIKTYSGKFVAQSIAFRVVAIAIFALDKLNVRHILLPL